jgi:hypothetical protein
MFSIHAEDVTYSISWLRVAARTRHQTRNAATGHLGDETEQPPTQPEMLQPRSSTVSICRVLFGRPELVSLSLSSFSSHALTPMPGWYPTRALGPSGPTGLPAASLCQSSIPIRAVQNLFTRRIQHDPRSSIPRVSSTTTTHCPPACTSTPISPCISNTLAVASRPRLAPSLSSEQDAQTARGRCQRDLQWRLVAHPLSG